MNLTEITPEVERRIAEQKENWKSMQRSSMERFLSRCSLHDSYLLGFNISADGGAEILLRWDVHQIDPDVIALDLEIQHRSDGRAMYTGEPPYLLITFSKLHHIIFDQDVGLSDQVITDVESRVLLPDERDLWLEHILKSTIYRRSMGEFLLNVDVCCTTFEGINPVLVVHSSPVSFLGIKTDGSLLHIPHL